MNSISIKLKHTFFLNEEKVKLENFRSDQCGSLEKSGTNLTDGRRHLDKKIVVFENL